MATPRRILLVFAACLFLSCSAEAQSTFIGYQSGDALLARCTGGETAQAFCHGYIIGVEEVLMGGNAVSGFKGCFPADASAVFDQVEKVVISYLQDHPELRHFYAPSLIAAAIARAYPCNQ